MSPSDWILLRPYWLWLLLPICFSALWLMRQRRAGDWEAVIDPVLLPVLLRLGLISGRGHAGWGALPLATAALCALALSGPAVPRPGEAAFRPTDPLVLVLDLSPSVVADPRVLTELKSTAIAVMEAAEGRPIGMMVYAADAYLASAPTTDRETIRSLVGVLESDTLPVPGSRPDLALSMARDLFAQGDATALAGADLVMVSDGGGMGPRATEEAARLGNDGARIWTLALPSATDAPKADPDALAEVARAGGGKAYPMREASTLSQDIARSRTARLARSDLTGHSYQDLGQWLLIPALFMLFPLFRRQR